MKVPAIDLILGGHDHHAVTTVESTTLISKSGQNANHLGVITLHLERDYVTNAVKMYLYCFFLYYWLLLVVVVIVFDCGSNHSWKMVLNRNIPKEPVVGGMSLFQSNNTKNF